MGKRGKKIKGKSEMKIWKGKCSSRKGRVREGNEEKGEREGTLRKWKKGSRGGRDEGTATYRRERVETKGREDERIMKESHVRRVTAELRKWEDGEIGRQGEAVRKAIYSDCRGEKLGKRREGMTRGR